MRREQFEDSARLAVALNDLADGGLFDAVALRNVLHGLVMNEVRVNEIDSLRGYEPLAVLAIGCTLEPFHVWEIFSLLLTFTAVHQTN